MKYSLSFTILTNLTNTFFGLLGSILLARLLGPEGRGELAVILLLPTFLVFLASFGLTPSIIFYSAQLKDKTSKIFANAVLLTIIQSVIACSVVYLTIPILLIDQTTEVLELSKIALLIVPIGLLTQYFLALLQSRLHFYAYNLIRLIIPVGYFLAVLTLWIFNGISLGNLIYFQVILNLTTLIFSLIAIIYCQFPLTAIPDISLGKKMVSYGFKVWVGDLSQSMNLKLDQLLIVAVVNTTALGYYVVALSAVNFSTVISEAFKSILAPTVSNQQDSDLKKNHILKLYEKYFGINVIVMLSLILSIPFLIPIIFGNEYYQSIIPGEILVIASLFINSKIVLSAAFQGLGKPIVPMKADIIGLLVTVILLGILLTPFGIIGAAIASLFAYFIQYIYMIFSLKNEFKLPLNILIKPNFSFVMPFIKRVFLMFNHLISYVKN